MSLSKGDLDFQIVGGGGGEEIKYERRDIPEGAQY